MRIRSAVLVLAILSSIRTLRAEEPVFSGPQVGEKLPEFKVRGVFGPHSGRELNFVKEADGKPLVLVFIHDTNSRPPLLMTKILTQYTSNLATTGVHTGVIWLSDEPAEAESRLKKIGYALCREAPIGISLDGHEGPGSYGLNRNATLTILIGKNGRVTANFALIQASMKTELPKILKALAAATGAPEATLDDLLVVNDEQFSAKLLSVVDRNATPEEVERDAVTIEKAMGRNDPYRQELTRLLRRLSDRGKLKDYGSPRAQEFLQKWAASPDAAEPPVTTPVRDQKK